MMCSYIVARWPLEDEIKMTMTITLFVFLIGSQKSRSCNNNKNWVFGKLYDLSFVIESIACNEPEMNTTSPLNAICISSVFIDANKIMNSLYAAKLPYYLCHTSRLDMDYPGI